MTTDYFDTWLALGQVGYARKPAEEKNIHFRRSLYIVKDIKAGESLTKEHVRRIRPSFGLAPKYYKEVLGKRVTRDIQRGTALKLCDLSKD